MRPDYSPDKEVRITSDTGGQKGQKSARFGGGDPLAYMELARVYGMGEEKYDRYNYLKGYAWSLSVDALFRHLFAFLSGEDRDPESGLLHTAHVAWHANTLTSFQLRHIGTDDRAPVAHQKAEVKTYPTKPRPPLFDSIDEDGCAVYRGQHIAMFIANDPAVYEQIDRELDADPIRCDHGVSLHRPCPDCRMERDDGA